MTRDHNSQEVQTEMKKNKKMITLVNGAIIVAVLSWLGLAAHATTTPSVDTYSATSVVVDY